MCFRVGRVVQKGAYRDGVKREETSHYGMGLEAHFTIVRPSETPSSHRFHNPYIVALVKRTSY